MGNGKIAVVTGAGSGIGRAVALALHGVGYAVVLAGRRMAALEETAAKCDALQPAMKPIQTDVSKPEQVQALFDAIRAEYGRLDLLFNNAGANAPGIAFEDLTYEQWSTVVGANLTGAFLCAQQAFRMMKAQEPRGGRIINNGSNPGTDEVPLAGWSGVRHCVQPDRHWQCGDGDERADGRGHEAGERRNDG
jgi:NAD(P)-dependent dehydrogenase (short-subunit alcohol dehydrogenase family)